MTLLLLLGARALAAAETLASWDLEESDGEFVAYGATSQWQWGEVGSGPEQAATGTRAWCTGLDRPYLNDTTDYLALPSLDLSGATRPVLRFYHWFEIDTDGDLGWVEVWDGAAWTRAEPIYGYPVDGGFSGNSDGWRPEWIDLSGVADSGSVRFVFSTNARVALAGWFLDDLAILDGDPVPPSIEVALAPEDTQDLEGPYTVRAWVRDDLATPSATLRWTAGGEEGSAEMSAVEAGLYEGEIPGQAPDTRVSWWVEASDGSNESEGPDDAQEFRVFLAAPTGLAGPDGRVIGTSVSLSWTAPDSPHEVLSYRIYCDDTLVAESEDLQVEAELCSESPSYSVSAVYAAGEGDRSDGLALEAWIPELSAVEPAEAWQGDHVRVSVVGETLLLVDGEVDLDLGADVEVEAVEVVDANRAVFTLEIGDAATPGEREGALQTGDLRIPLPSPFTILDGESRPRLVAISPEALVQGRSYTVLLLASADLDGEPSLDLGEGVVVEEVRWEDGTIEADVVVAWDAPVGERAVSVDDGSRLLDGVDLLVRNAATTPQSSCATASGEAAAPLAALLGLLTLSRRGRRAGARSPRRR